MIYIGLAAVTTALAFGADKFRNDILRAVCIAGWILSFCLIAGARDASVGVDVLVYGYNTYITASEKDLFAFLGSFYGAKDGVGCALLFWFATQISCNFGFFLAIAQLACVAPYCVGVYKISNRTTWFSVLFYALYIFPLSLCLVKQMIACSLIFLAVTFMKEQRFKPFLACVLIATSFHMTALITLLFYPLFNESMKELLGKQSLFRKQSRACIIVAAAVLLGLVYIFREPLLLMLSVVKQSYIAQFNSISEAHFTFAPLLLLLPLAYVGYIRKRRLSNEAAKREEAIDSAYEASIAFIIFLGFVASELSLISPQLYRVSHYFMILIPMYCGQLIQSKDKKSVALITLGVVCYFILTVLIQGIGGVEPYTSAFFGLEG